MIAETFRFENEGDYENKIYLNFFAYSQNIDSLESFSLHFSLEKLALLSLVKEVTPSPDRKMIKLLTFDILFSPTRHSRENS